MKKLLLTVTLLMFAVTAQAETIKFFDRHGDHFHRREAEVHSKTVDTNSDTWNGNELGLGADVILWEADKRATLIRAVEAQYKYDLDNKNHAGYLVAKVNLWSKIKGLFKKETYGSRAY